MPTKQITINVELDEEHIPSNIEWSADDLQGMDHANCRAMLLSLWDNRNKDTLKLDLWTRDMTVDEMKIFFHQTLISLSETFYKATQDEKMTATMKDFCDYFAEKLELKK